MFVKNGRMKEFIHLNRKQNLFNELAGTLKTGNFRLISQIAKKSNDRIQVI